MSGLSDDVVYEAVELSEAVFSDGEAVFNRDYDGEIGAYMVVEDVRNRIEVATMDAGEMVYPEELLGFEELGGEEAVEIFYSIEPGEDVDVPDVFLEAGLVEEADGDIFYGENALPYLFLIDEAEKVFEPIYHDAEVIEPDEGPEYFEAEVLDQGKEDPSFEKQEVEPGSGSRKDESDVSEGEEAVSVEEEDKLEELSRIWDDVSGSGS